jgi:RHS repeat-associated protein
VKLARLHYAEGDLRSLSSGHLHVLLEMPDHLGSSSIVIDRETSELVERSTYLAPGTADSDYRTERWDSFREDYPFTGKEEDSEVGLAYFGARYLAPSLGRWISADPLAVHGLGADMNVYAYVSGKLLSATDPLGLEETKTPATAASTTPAAALVQEPPARAEPTSITSQYIGAQQLAARFAGTAAIEAIKDASGWNGMGAAARIASGKSQFSGSEFGRGALYSAAGAVNAWSVLGTEAPKSDSAVLGKTVTASALAAGAGGASAFEGAATTTEAVVADADLAGAATKVAASGGSGAAATEGETVTYYRVQGGSPPLASRNLVQVDAAGNVTFKNSTLNVSVGNMEHAQYFLNQRQGARITSFEVPKWFHELAIDAAIPQKGYRTNPMNQGGLAPKIVDPTTPGLSLELPPIWSQWLNEVAVPGSGKVH